MISLIYGGSGSGKSEYAEGIVLKQSGPGERYYIATMLAFGEEGKSRVERHRRLRAGKGFQTIECPCRIESALQKIPDPSAATILLECMSNLVANEMFGNEEEGLLQPDQPEDFDEERILSGLRTLCTRVKHAVIVTNNVFEDGVGYDEQTVRYVRHLGSINCRIAEMADQVTEVVAGIPVPVSRQGEPV